MSWLEDEARAVHEDWMSLPPWLRDLMEEEQHQRDAERLRDLAEWPEGRPALP